MLGYAARQGFKAALVPASTGLCMTAGWASETTATKATARGVHSLTTAAARRPMAAARAKNGNINNVNHKSGGKRSASFVAWYEQRLQSHPVPTKMVTGGFLWGLGDVVAQVAPHLASSSNDGNDDTQQPKPFSLDTARTCRAAFFGGGIHAPLSHLHFNFLEYLTVRASVTGLGIPVFKAFMEQFVYWSWFSNSLYHGAMGALQGQDAAQIVDRIQNVLWGTQVAQWKFWIPIQLLNFQFTPIRHQLNVVLVTSVIWTALLSAWYPPEDDDKDNNDAADEASV